MLLAGIIVVAAFCAIAFVRSEQRFANAMVVVTIVGGRDDGTRVLLRPGAPPTVIR